MRVIETLIHTSNDSDSAKNSHTIINSSSNGFGDNDSDCNKKKADSSTSSTSIYIISDYCSKKLSWVDDNAINVRAVKHRQPLGELLLSYLPW